MPVLAGGDRVRRPGAAHPRPARVGSIAADLAELEEDVEDLAEPVDEISWFDQCLYTVGARDRPDYVYQRPETTLARALSSASRVSLIHGTEAGESDSSASCRLLSSRP